MKSLIRLNNEAKETMMTGVNMIADTVKTTLGGAGRTVVIDYRTYDTPHITKDGVTVANSVFLTDPIEQAGARLIKNVANNAVNTTGDGTTTATVIAQSLLNLGNEWLTEHNCNTVEMARGMELAKDQIIKDLTKKSRKIKYGSKRLEHIATLSANGDKEIGSIVAQAVNMAGPNGKVTIEEGDGVSTILEHTDGVTVDSGWLSPYFVNNTARQTIEYDNPLIFISNLLIEKVEDILPIIKLSIGENRPLIIVAKEVIGEALQTMVVNAVQKGTKITAIENPSFGAFTKGYLEDLCAATGGTFISEESGISVFDVDTSMLGQADKVIIGQTDTTFVGAKGDKLILDARVEKLRDELENTNDPGDKNFIEDRLAKLAGGVVLLKVGATTSTEMKERKDRFDDSLGATMVAVENGVVRGAGLDLASVASELDIKSISHEDQNLGISIVREACRQPSLQILMNAGLSDIDAELKVNHCLANRNIAYDVVKRSNVDCYKSGLIDPLSVVVSSLESAVSVASTVLTSEAIVVNVD